MRDDVNDGDIAVVVEVGGRGRGRGRGRVVGVGDSIDDTRDKVTGDETEEKGIDDCICISNKDNGL